MNGSFRHSFFIIQLHKSQWEKNWTMTDGCEVMLCRISFYYLSVSVITPPPCKKKNLATMKMYFTCLAAVIGFFISLLPLQMWTLVLLSLEERTLSLYLLSFCPWDWILYKEYTEQLNQNKQKLKEKSMQSQHFWLHRIKTGTVCYPYIKEAFNKHATEQKSPVSWPCW